MDVAVVGGGIGGLSLALRLERAGIDCRVYESVPAYAPLGVGINLFPLAVRRRHALLTPGNRKCSGQLITRSIVAAQGMLALMPSSDFAFNNPRLKPKKGHGGVRRREVRVVGRRLFVFEFGVFRNPDLEAHPNQDLTGCTA